MEGFLIIWWPVVGGRRINFDLLDVRLASPLESSRTMIYFGHSLRKSIVNGIRLEVRARDDLVIRWTRKWTEFRGCLEGWHHH